MYTSCGIIYFVIFVHFVKSNLDKNWLPDVFEIDDYVSCMSANKIYCKYKLKLKSSSPTNISETWNRIKDVQDKRQYSREQLYTGVCHDDIDYNISKLQNQYKLKYKNYGIDVEYIDKISCQEPKNNIKLDQSDVILTFIVAVYIITVMYATIADYRNIIQHNRIGTILVQLSVIHSINLILKPQKIKVKCIEGLRVFTMFAIIFCHTYGSYSAAYLRNTQFVESLSFNVMKFVVFQNLLFLVQTFFLISGWLLSYQVYQFFEKRKKFTLQDVGVMFLKRYLRLIPVIVTMIVFHSLKFTTSNSLGIHKEIFLEENTRCRNNYWLTLLFLSNFIQPSEICNLGSWYLTADVQLYLISLLIIYICLRFPMFENYILMAVLTFVMSAMVLIIYINELDICYSIFPRDIAVNNVFSSKEFLYLYYSTLSNAATYITGVFFGKLYFKMESKKEKLISHSVIHGFLFMGLPMLAVMICFYDYSLIIRSILGAIIKPLYSLGIAIGIKWMAQGGGGIIKKICECELVMMLSNFSYTTYIFHIAFVFSRTAFSKQLLDLTMYNLIKSYLYDAVISLIYGITMHILVELPGISLRKYLISKTDQKNFDKIKEQ